VSTSTLATTSGLRSDVVRGAFDRAALDGTTLVINHSRGDALVDAGAIRDVTRVLATRGADRGMRALIYSLADLAQTIVAPGAAEAQVPTGISDRTPPTVALDTLRDACLSSRDPHLLMIDYVEHILAPDQLQSASGDTGRIIQQLVAIGADPEWHRAGHQLVLIARTAPLDEHVTRLPRMSMVDLGLPQYEERLAALQLLMQSTRHRLHLAAGIAPERVAQAMGGLTVHEMSAMRYHTTPETPLELEHIVRHKHAGIRRAAGSLLTIHDEPLKLDTDVAGNPQVRRFVQEELTRGNSGFMLILAGPAGVGKTRISTTIGAAFGMPVLELGQILNQWLGASENNMRTILEILAANAPCVLLMDEIDQGPLGRRGESTNGGDGGHVVANLRAQLFTRFGDTGARDGISVIGMTNRADLLDAAATDRFTIIPVLHPTPWESAHIMDIQARREGIDFDRDASALELIDGDVAISGRQAVRVFDRAHAHSVLDGRLRVEAGDVRLALRESLHTLGVEEERQSLLAVRATTWTAHLPWNAARFFGDETAEPPPYLRRLVRSDGSVDLPALNGRIAELEGRRG